MIEPWACRSHPPAVWEAAPRLSGTCRPGCAPWWVALSKFPASTPRWNCCFVSTSNCDISMLQSLFLHWMVYYWLFSSCLHAATSSALQLCSSALASAESDKITPFQPFQVKTFWFWLPSPAYESNFPTERIRLWIQAAEYFRSPPLNVFNVYF